MKAAFAALLVICATSATSATCADQSARASTPCKPPVTHDGGWVGISCAQSGTASMSCMACTKYECFHIRECAAL